MNNVSVTIAMIPRDLCVPTLISDKHGAERRMPGAKHGPFVEERLRGPLPIASVREGDPDARWETLVGSELCRALWHNRLSNLE